MQKPVIYVPWITRQLVRASPEDIFVYGDNVQREGYGGQAKEMRGEPNAIGVATKRRPYSKKEDYFSDNSTDDLFAVWFDLSRVINEWKSGKQIKAPTNGLGTERAELKTRAPFLFLTIVETFRKISDASDFPWK
jgi:hypothetical protein